MKDREILFEEEREEPGQYKISETKRNNEREKINIYHSPIVAQPSTVKQTVGYLFTRSRSEVFVSDDDEGDEEKETVENHEDERPEAEREVRAAFSTEDEEHGNGKHRGHRPYGKALPCLKDGRSERED